MYLDHGQFLLIYNSLKTLFSSSISGKTTYIDPRIVFAAKPKIKGKVKVDSSKTALDVLKDKNLTGKVVIVTGANSGIGESLNSLENDLRTNQKLEKVAAKI